MSLSGRFKEHWPAFWRLYLGPIQGIPNAARLGACSVALRSRFLASSAREVAGADFVFVAVDSAFAIFARASFFEFHLPSFGPIMWPNLRRNWSGTKQRSTHTPVGCCALLVSYEAYTLVQYPHRLMRPRLAACGTLLSSVGLLLSGMASWR